MNICQSCSMPMTEENMYGKNKDGSNNTEYCIYCYPNGEFKNPHQTFDEMIEICVPFFMKESKMDENAARNYIINQLKSLKRWTKG